MKNQSLAVALSLIPGLGLLYLGKPLLAAKCFAAFVVTVFLYANFIDPFITEPLVQSANSDLLEKLIRTLIDLPFIIVYLWSMIMSYHLAYEINSQFGTHKPILIKKKG